MSRIHVRTLAVCLLILPGCFSSKAIVPDGVAPGSATEALGSIEVSSSRLGRMTVVPTSCFAGARQLFLGADFADEKAGAVVRLVVDPVASPAVRVFSSEAPFDKSIVFHREECSAFHFTLDSTGWRINRIDDYRVTLDVDCSRDGESVRGRLSTTHCH